ncbi:MAG: DNA repair protein RecO [Clostridiaceae bacterium]|nr:DNA repair protein RecO [Clostridiaceae bacterium]
MKTDLSPEERIGIRGLVLRTYEEKGANRTLALLTAERGMLRAAAFGSGKANSPLAGGTQVFTLADFTLLSRRGAYRVEEAVSIEQFRGLTRDIARFALASYFSELLCDASPAGTECGGAFRLALYALHALSIQNRPPELVRAAFTFRLMSITGFEPELSGDGTHFYASEGRIDTRGVALTPGALAALRHIADSPEEKVFSFSVGEDSLRVLADACEQYTRVCSEREYETLDYYKKIIL